MLRITKEMGFFPHFGVMSFQGGFEATEGYPTIYCTSVGDYIPDNEEEYDLLIQIQRKECEDFIRMYEASR